MIKVRDPVLYLFLLKLKVTVDFILDYVNKNLGLIKVLLEKKLELVLRKRFYLTPTLLLISAKADPLTKKRSNK